MTCDKCGGTGVDEARACSSLAMPGMNAYIAAMYPCPQVWRPRCLLLR